jgi:putative heme-binding domain-containing protein
MFVLAFAGVCDEELRNPGDGPPSYPEHQNLSYYLDRDGQRQPVATIGDWEIRRQHLLANMQEVMGELPGEAKRVPLDVKLIDEVRVGKLIRRKITYQSDPDDRVAAYLFIPNGGKRKSPAVLCLQQTTTLGKDEPAGLGGDPNLSYALHLAQRGYVTLAPDYPSFGEHAYDFAPSRGYQSGTMKAIWDNVRAVDLLQSLPEVDADRIGCIGHSLGGHNTMFTAAFDTRIKVMVSSCGFTRFHKDDMPSWTGPRYMPLIASRFGNDADRVPFDFTEIVGSFAPRPFLACAAVRDDDFDVSGVRDVIAAVKPVYELFGKPDQLAAYYPDSKHAFPDDARTVAYEFLDKHLRQTTAQAPTTSLEARLSDESSAALARAARELGDARRGAVIFHQPHLACSKCHATGERSTSLGPDLTAKRDDVTGEDLIESLLAPSKVIKKGFETVTVGTTDGRVVTGLLVKENPDSVVVRDPSQPNALVTIAKDTIELRNDHAPSIMPAGQVNQLGSRQEFLDLIRFLIEIAELGPERAKELRPASSFFATPLPDYEKSIDHAGMIASLGTENLKRGEAIYNRLCVNCHGTKEQPGSLPTSLRFASGNFKNGRDPFRMYQTLTHGFGMMTPQTWMVPQQKYDVIHYIRETYLRESNPTQYTRIDERYLAGLPKGTTRGPKPTTIEPWATMNYGPNLIATYEVGDDGSNFAYKGIAVRLDGGTGGVARGRQWMMFDHDTLRVAAAWNGDGFIDWNGINFNGRHQVHPRAVGTIQFANRTGPGWANPGTGRFDDTRLRGRDGRPYGPLPRDWAHYKGLYHFGNQVIVAYNVGKASVLEMPSYENGRGDQDDPEGVSAARVGSRTQLTVFVRTLNIGPSPHDLALRVAPAGTPVAISEPEQVRMIERNGDAILNIPAASTPLKLKIFHSNGDPESLQTIAKSSAPPASLESMTHGGPKRWPEILETQAVIGTDAGPFAVDVLTPPDNNPWFCQLRLTGFDFFPDGDRAAVCSWDGDVWLVSGLDSLHGDRSHRERADGSLSEPATLHWQRIASGLFQPLGLKIVDGRIYVTCRDQIVILHDLNGDGETDFYENFNNDHQVSEHFHEFAMGLQIDTAGNFYYAKSARHALPAIVPHHGTLLRVSKDGSRTEILATGFRAANGVCLNPDGSFVVTDQEGHWNPKNRINWVTPGGFYGNMFGYHDVTDSSDRAMQQPLCWITNSFDRSPAELLWVTSDSWRPLKGSLLNLSYGYGKVFVVPHENVNGQMQGGMCALPIPNFPTGIIRGRFHPTDGQLYLCGMYSWAGSQTQPGGFYRLRYTGKPVHLPIGLNARRNGMSITFSGALGASSASDPKNYAIKSWSLKRTANYGSDHHDEKPSRITRANLSPDGRTIFLETAGMRPTWCMEIKYTIKSASGEPVDGVINNTVHELASEHR